MASVMNVPRPPTPPRSSSKYGLPAEIESDCAKESGLAATPEDTPNSEKPSHDTGSGKDRKRVDFSPWAPPVFTSSPNVQHQVRPLPPSRECRSSTSILKTSAQSTSEPSLEVSSAHPYDSLSDMLKSVLQQLSTDNRSINIDAYATVAGSFKAYNDIAEGPKLREQVHSLCKYIRRDLQNETSDAGVADANLVTSALKVVVVLVWDKCLSAMLTDEFRSFLLDRSIKVLENEKSTKAVVLHYLHLLATQNFRSNVMTNSRATRALEAMQLVTQRIAGNNVIIERQMVYQKFTEQTPPAMKMRLDWLESLIDGMTSNVAFVRDKSISFGTAAAKAFGSDSSVCKHLNTIFDRELEDGQNYLSHSIRKLDGLLSKSDEGTAVPRIWAITIRLLRGSNLQSFERGKHLKRLLVLIQRCFNSSHADVRTAAYSAWNQFIFSVQPSDKTPRTLRQVLATPITGQLSRSDAGKLSKSHRTAAASAYCCLLYYSLRPGGHPEQYTPLFLEYISNIWTEPFLSITSNVDRACRIFMALFWNEKGRFWAETRVHELSIFEPEDLPRVDPKWVRSQSKHVFDVFEHLFRKAYWGPQYPETSFVARSWSSLCQALGEACRREVKPSAETMDTVTHFMNLLHKIWEQGPVALNASDASSFLDRFWFLLRTMVVQIGGIPFTEHCLNDPPKLNSTSRSDNTAVSSTPHSVTAFELLLLLLGEQPDSLVLDGTKLTSIVEAALQLLVDNRASAVSKLQLFAASLVRIVEGAEMEANTLTNDNLNWVIRAILQVTKDTLKTDSKTPGAKERESEHVLEDSIVTILRLGLCAKSTVAEQWADVFHEAVNHTKASKGNKIVVLKIFEPLAHDLGKQLSSSTTLNLAVLIRSFAETREFWGTSTLSKRETLYMHDPSHFVETVTRVVNRYLLRSYTCASVDDVLPVRNLLSACVVLIRACPERQVNGCFLLMSEGLVKWLQDPDRYMGGVQDIATAKRSSARPLWSSVICRLCETTDEPQKLEILEPLFIACFDSTQKDVVNMVIEKWNQNFSTNKTLEYSPALASVLLRLRPHVDLELPGLEYRENEMDYSSPPRFSDADTDDERDSEILSKPFMPLPLTPKQILKSSEPLHSKSGRGKLNTASPSTPTVSRRGLRKSETSKMLPHNDSQLEFAIIDTAAPSDHDLESQCMTEHQKDVRERQKSDVTAAFYDLRSSPGRETERTRRSESAGLPTVLADKVSAEPFTPDLAPDDPSGADDHAMSSPTPQSSHKTTKLCDVDVPSSPMSGLEDQETNKATGIHVIKEANGGPAEGSQDLVTEVEHEESVIDDFGHDPNGTEKPFQQSGPIKQTPRASIISTTIILGEISPNIQTEPLHEHIDEVEDFLPSRKKTTHDGSASIQNASAEIVKDPMNFKNTLDTRERGVRPTVEGGSDPPHTDSDEFDSQISIQLSQDMANYDDSWQTAPGVGTALSDEPFFQAAEAYVSKPLRFNGKPLANKASELIRPAAQEMGDTIIVLPPQTRQMEDTGSQRQWKGDFAREIQSPLLETGDDLRTTTPAEEILSSPPIIAKRKAEALSSEGAVDDLTNSVSEGTPTKRVKQEEECTAQVEGRFSQSPVQDHPAPSNNVPTDHASESEERSGNDMENQEVAQADDSGASIILSLRDVWQRLGQTKISRDELRAIHDLVFDIRSTAEESVRRGI